MRQIYFITLFILFYITASSQSMSELNDIYFKESTILIDTNEIEKKANLRVNLLDHFFDRINMRQNIYSENVSEKIKNLKATYPNYIQSKNYKNVKKEMIMSLVDLSSEKLSKNFSNIADLIVTEKLSIDYKKNNWYALTSNDFLIKGESKKGFILLKLLQTKFDHFEWVIIEIFIPYIQQYFNVKEDFLQPMIHETGFIDLKRIFKKDSNIQDYFMNPKYDQSDKIISMINNEDILLENIIDTKFIFEIDEESFFTVSYFNRNEFNSGWLIEGITYYDYGCSILEVIQSY